MSRIESSKVKIEEKPFHLPDLLHDIRTIIQPTIASKQLDFLIDTVDVVDENVSKMLKEIGMRSEWTVSGKEAVIRAKNAMERGDEFYAYIIDWLMPDRNGIETVRRIRRVIGDSHPIIILTAYDWSDVEEEAREAGVTAFCEKPLFMSELRGSLDGQRLCRGRAEMPGRGHERPPCKALGGAEGDLHDRKIPPVMYNFPKRSGASPLLFA